MFQIQRACRHVNTHNTEIVQTNPFPLWPNRESFGYLVYLTLVPWSFPTTNCRSKGVSNENGVFGASTVGYGDVGTAYDIVRSNNICNRLMGLIPIPFSYFYTLFLSSPFPLSLNFFEAPPLFFELCEVLISERAGKNRRVKGGRMVT